MQNKHSLLFHNKHNLKLRENGFTLVELLVVISIIGILATVLVDAFVSSQMRGRDAQRKSDLKQIANALELYYNDYGQYPSASGGLIIGCPAGSGNCSWGSTSGFTDTKTTYMQRISKDPSSSQNYYFRIVSSSSNKKFQLYAHLENTQDSSCINGTCSSPPTLPAGVSCGTGISCNYAVTSGNALPTDN